MRNEIDEEFVKVHKEVKKTLENLLIAVIEAENPDYTRTAPESQLEIKIQGTLPKKLAVDMISAMYLHDEQKKNEIIDKLSNIIENSIAAGKGQKPKNKDRVIKEEIKYKDLEKIVLDNLVRTHHSYLTNLRNLFRKQDSNNYGYIDQIQFNELMDSFDQFDTLASDKLYYSVNPDGVEHITFSELVQGFAQQHVVQDEHQLTILDYIYTIET